MYFRKDLIRGQSRRERSLEEFVALDDPFAATASGNDLRPQRSCNETPFRGRIGVSKTASEGAALPDRKVRNVPHDLGQETTKRTRNDTSMKRGMARQGANRNALACRLNGGQFLQFIDVD